MKLKKFVEFLDENPDITILGIAWACYWRMMLVIMGGYICFAIIAIFFAGLASI